MVKKMRALEDDEKAGVSVTQDNALVSASYVLTLAEKRVLLLATSKINPFSKHWLENGEVEVSAQDLVNIFGIDQKSSYRVLKESLDKLANRWVWLSPTEKIRWLSQQKYSEGQGEIVFNFSREMVMNLSGMVDYFTSYKIMAASGFKSVYSIRIYEFCKQYENTGIRIDTVESLRSMLGTEYKYSSWSLFRQFAIKPAVKEINEKSDITVRFEVVKKGRNIHAVKFLIDRNTQYQLPL